MERSNLQAILNTKKELLIRMRDITKNICCLITEEDIEELKDRIQDRQEIIMLIDVLNQQINDIDPENQMEPGLRKEICSIIADIIVADSENKGSMEKTLDSYCGQIRDLNLSKKGKIRYSSASKKDGIFIDKKK